MKKLFVMCVAVALAAVLPVRAAEYNWKFGLVDSTTNPNYLAAEELTRYLEEEAPGKWSIQLYPSSQLGGSEEMLEAIQMGALEMCAPPSSAVANYVPEYGVWDMPYLFLDEAHVDAVMDGEIGARYIAMPEKANIKVAGWWEVGFRCLANNKHPVNSVDDVVGLRLRVMSNEIHQALFSALGADPVPMSLSDAYIANQNGTIDGQDNPLPNLYANNVYEVCRYVAVTRHVYTPLPVCMSMTAWNSMSKADQEVFARCMQRASKWQKDTHRAKSLDAAANLESKGCQITYPALEPFAAKMQVVYDKYPQFKDEIAAIRAARK